MAKSKVKYLKGTVEGPSKRAILDQHDAWKEDADCGCGLDCCNKKIVLTDQVTDAITSIYVENGELILEINGGGKFKATLTTV